MAYDEYDAEFFEKLSEELEAGWRRRLEELQDSDDPKVRESLLSVADEAQFSDPAQVLRVREHSLWLIARRPTASVHRHPAIQRRLDAEGHAAAASLWLDHLSRDPNNLGILRNAAEFHASTDLPRAKALLERGEVLDPRNADWPCRIGDLLSLQARSRPESERAHAKEALAAYQRALEKSDDKFGRAHVLESLADISLLLGELDRAAEHARELLRHAGGPSTRRQDGDAVYTGHSVLGSIALQRGEVEEACRELLEAGKTPGSPVLGSFGPEFDLANALLQRGRREVVVEFLKLCATFWDPERVGRWIDQIHAGETPTLDRRECP